MMNRFPRVGVDLDGVLSDFVRPFCYLLNELGADVAWPLDDPDFPPSWNWFDAYPTCTAELVDKAWTAIKESSAFWATLPTQASARDDLAAIVNAISHGWDVYFITTRPGLTAKFQSEAWLCQKGIKVPFVPTVLLAGNSAAKGMLALALGLDAFIDDRPENLVSVKKACSDINGFLMDQPYNRRWFAESGHAFATKVQSVRQMLDAVAAGWRASAEASTAGAVQ